MKYIVITSPDNIDNEAEKITALFEHGIDYVHIRKPDADHGQLHQLIEDIPAKYRYRLTLHDHYRLCKETGTGGIHLNDRNLKLPSTRMLLTETSGQLRISRSLHSLEEIAQTDCEGYHYRTLAPIFASISKAGYASAFHLQDIKSEIIGKRIVALGGVTPAHHNLLEETGFWGVALLGYIWGDDFDTALAELTKRIDLESINTKRITGAKHHAD